MSWNLDKITALLSRLPDGFEGREAQAGWFESAQYPDGTPVAYAAVINEFGAPARKIPARPFIRPAIEENKNVYIEILEDGAKKVLRGGISADSVLEAVGMKVVGDIKKSISEINSPALSPITVMLRKMKRENSSLVVTGKTVGEAASRIANGESPGSENKPLTDSRLMISTVINKVADAD